MPPVQCINIRNVKCFCRNILSPLLYTVWVTSDHPQRYTNILYIYTVIQYIYMTLVNTHTHNIYSICSYVYNMTYEQNWTIIHCTVHCTVPRPIRPTWILKMKIPAIISKFRGPWLQVQAVRCFGRMCICRCAHIILHIEHAAWFA